MLTSKKKKEAKIVKKNVLNVKEKNQRMMSESDDTDVLLLIPPDLFFVPSSDSEDFDFLTDRSGYGLGVPGTTRVVTELFDQVKSLENRMSVIESKDTSLDASLSDNHYRVNNVNQQQQQQRSQLASSRNRFSSVSHISSLLNTPTKPRQYSSVPSTPSSNRNNSYDTRSYTASHNNTNALKSIDRTNSINVNNIVDDDLKSRSDTSMIRRHSNNYEFGNMGIPHASGGSDNRNNRSVVDKQPDRISFSLPSAVIQGIKQPERSVREMELSEVDELLHEMENTEAQIARRINDKSLYKIDSRFVNEINSTPARRLDFAAHDANRNRASVPFDEDSLHLDETDKMISDFKIWRQNGGRAEIESKSKTPEAFLSLASQKLIINDQSVADLINGDGSPLHASLNHDNVNTDSITHSKAYTSVHSTRIEPELKQIAQVHNNKKSYSTGNLFRCTNNDGNCKQNNDDVNRISNDAATNTENSRYLFTRCLL